MKPREDRDTVTQPGSLTPERFAQVRAIFEAALERPAAERRGYVDGACGADAALRREVEAMLAAEARPDALLDRRPSSSAPEEGRFPAGTVLAVRYRILGLLGHCGVGEVYKAFDLILNQTVALKLLVPAHISEAALIRFRNERPAGVASQRVPYLRPGHGRGRRGPALSVDGVHRRRRRLTYTY